MESLVKRGLLRARTAAMEWLVPESEDASMSPDGCVISFVLFREHGLVSPPHRFFRRLGIEPHFEL
jgi:hypothetical protein